VQPRVPALTPPNYLFWQIDLLEPADSSPVLLDEFALAELFVGKELGGVAGRSACDIDKVVHWKRGGWERGREGERERGEKGNGHGVCVWGLGWRKGGR